MKKATLSLLAMATVVSLAGCTALMDAAALLASLKDKSGLIENWHATVLDAQAPNSLEQTKSLSGLATTPDILGLETLLVKLSDGSVYPVICPGSMTSRCRQMTTGTKVFINSGNVVPCNVSRDGQLYGSCIAATELRQEM